MKSIVVIYHKFCSDGFGGAWAAWHKFGDKATYIGMEHKMPPPIGLKGKNVYMIDFSYKSPVIKKILQKVCEISKKAGMDKIRLEVNDQNVNAISFYEKNGFYFEKNDIKIGRDKFFHFLSWIK
jgi:NADPH-dependent ferric siderophore reductase